MAIRTKTTVAACATLLAASAIATAPAHADTDTDFLSRLSAAGIDYANPIDTASLGESICSLLVEPGKTFASAVAKVRDNGIPPQMAAFFAGVAIQMYCPAMLASVTDGSVLNQLGGLPGVATTGIGTRAGTNALPVLSALLEAGQ
ncbi:MAG: DUF732 domain-containing protein [Actinomycetota bacterium]|nr:DUF732 domain-containing protein [Actinomycetota bacterium]